MYGNFDRNLRKPKPTDIVFRNSTGDSMALCGAREGLKKSHDTLEVWSEELSFGSTLHACIEKLFKTKNHDSIIYNDAALQKIIAKVMEEYSFDLPTELVDKWVEELKLPLSMWSQRIFPTIRADFVKAEPLLYMPLGSFEDKTVWLQGTPDLVLSHRIDDWKSTGRDWDYSRALFANQPSSYMALVEYALEYYIRSFRHWVWNRKKQEWTAIDTERTDQQIEAVKRNLYQYAIQLYTDTWTAKPVVSEFGKYKRGWYCSPKYCSAWNVCEFKYLPDTRDESEVAELSL